MRISVGLWIVCYGLLWEIRMCLEVLELFDIVIIFKYVISVFVLINNEGID